MPKLPAVTPLSQSTPPTHYNRNLEVSPNLTIRTFLRFFLHAQLLPVLESGEETLVGGQAVMEGVMMRAPHSYCVAVRKATGDIVTEELAIPRLSEKYPWAKYPIIRGLVTLGHAMALGMKALKFSTNAALDDGSSEKPTELPAWVTSVQLIFTLLFFVVVYKFIPLKLATYVSNWAPSLKGQIAFNAVDGLIRLAIFVVFLFGISRSKDIRRMFRISRRRAQGGLQLRIRQARHRRERAEVRHLASALRHQLPVRHHADFDARLHGRARSVRSPPKWSSASRSCR